MNMDAVYQKALEHLGPQNWPAEPPFEVVLAAILSPGTNWKKVLGVLESLKSDDLLNAAGLSELTLDELGEWFQPVGHSRRKAARLNSFLRLLGECYGGSLEKMFRADAATLREQLLGINGVGPETADSILLYAAAKVTSVVDAATYRIALRHGWIGFETGYDELKDYFESQLPDDLKRRQELHALLVQVGKRYCRPREARCAECPLESFLPEGGPIGCDGSDAG